MNKQKKVIDPEIVARVKNYLSENKDMTYVDVSQMARLVKERYREYSNTSDSAFRQMVENAYKEVIQSYGLDAATTSDEDSDECEMEMLGAGPSGANQGLPANKKRHHLVKRRADEPIDVLSSEEETTPAIKLPKLSNQITIIPHTVKKDSHLAPNTLSVITHSDGAGPSNDNRQHSVPWKNKTMRPKNAVVTQEFKVTFKDIGGKSEILPKVRDFLLHMENPAVYKKLGIKPPRGALLHGPPGTGKTLLAKAIAGQTQLPMLVVTGPSLVGGVSGESESRIREIFKHAVIISPCILFLDEIDSICTNRANALKDMERRMVTQLLASFDDLNELEANVLVLATTSNPDILDPALRRSGRLELEIALGIPSQETRKEILELLCRNFLLDDDIDIKTLAELTPGFVGADLQTLVNAACTNALKEALNPTVEVDPEPKTNPSSDEGALKTNGMDKPSSSNSNENPAPIIEVVDLDQSDPEVTVNSHAHNGKPDILQDKLSIKQEHFLKALKTTRPMAVKEGIVTVPDVTWDDIGSLKSVRKDLQMAVLAPVKYPEQMKRLGLHAPSGVLLCGPPGCGKTLLAKAVANEAGVNFISVKGPELLNMYVGESERAVRTCFRRALNSAPCVIFFDEFDSLCPKRGQQDNSGASRVVNQLLTEMDGIESREGVFVLAASNRPDIIDPAILRPGRLDKVIYVGMPGRDDRIEIFKKVTKEGTQPPLDQDVDLEAIADKTNGFTGADLAGLVRGAATLAMAQHINDGTVDKDILVTADNFREALLKCKPSVSAKELSQYEKLRIKYSTESEDKVMEIETDLIEESMETA